MTTLFLYLTLIYGISEAPPFYDNKIDLLYYLSEENQQIPIDNAADWQLRKHHILENMQLVMGKLPEIDHASSSRYEIVAEQSFPSYRRQTIHYKVDGWDTVPAFLFLPNNQDGKAKKKPAVLCLHPTSPIGKRVCAGEGNKSNRNYAEELVKRGYITLAPDYPGFGEYVEARQRLYEEGYVSCTMKGIVNHICAIDLLESLPQVDPERIGCIGHSLGGHNTLFVSVFDTRIKVAVSSCGFTLFPKYKNGDITGWTHDGYMPRIDTVYKKDPAKIPFDFSEVLAAIAPRTVFICAPIKDDNFEVSGVKDAVHAARSIFALLHAEDNLRVSYPDAEHDFPLETRLEAYELIDIVLKNNE